MSKEKVYISGHRNPDLDSMCSAYAYAILKNQIDPEREYIAVRCGHMTDSSRKIFANLGVTPPMYFPNITPTASDVMMKTDQKVQADALLSELAETYSENNPSAVPVFEGENFYGLISVDEITRWVMTELAAHKCVDQVPRIRDIMGKQEEPISAHEFFDEAKAKLSASKKRGLAVADENGYCGYVTRRCFLKAPRHNLILVDHNEPKQSIMGIETANIMEIIDHHRLDSVKTELPVYIDAEPLGSTCTIVYRQFLLHGVIPDDTTAKVLLTGIVSDTLVLRSPTTTPTDIKVANELALHCRIDLQEFGMAMFSCIEGLKNRQPEEAINSDFKTYQEKGIRFGIAQCEVTTLHDLDDYRQLYAETLEDIRRKNALDWAVLMITNVLTENSVLLTTDYKANKYLRYKVKQNGVLDMPGVMSRKKQLLPELISSLGMI